MSITWQGNFDFEPLQAVIEHLPEWLDEGAQDVKDEAVRLCPKETGELADSAYTESLDDFGGVTELIGFHKPWASKEHEDLYYHHLHGGQPKYLESAINSKGQDAYNHVAERCQETLSA